MKEFNRTTLGLLRQQIETALNKIAQDNGLNSLSIGNMSYSPDGKATCKLTATIGNNLVGKNAVNKDTMAMYLQMYGLPEDTIGKEFTSNGRTFKITDVNPNRPKFPISATCIQDGRGYKFPTDQVKFRLGIK